MSIYKEGMSAEEIAEAAIKSGKLNDYEAISFEKPLILLLSEILLSQQKALDFNMRVANSMLKKVEEIRKYTELEYKT